MKISLISKMYELSYVINPKMYNNLRNMCKHVLT